MSGDTLQALGAAAQAYAPGGLAEEIEPYTVAYAAARLRVTEQWLRKEAAAGRVPSLKLGQRRLFLERHLAEILAAAEVGRSTGLSAGSLRAKRRAS